MAITERPYTYAYTKNEIRYVFTLTDLDRAGLYLQAKIRYQKFGDPGFADLYTFEGLKPDTDGKVYLYIQAYINSVNNYVMPVHDAIKTNANDQACRYYVEFREIEDADPDPDWDDSETSFIRIAIKGGIERHKASRNNIFVNYIETQKPFLTWQPTKRYVFANELVYLSFFNMDMAGFRIRIAMNGINNTSLVSYVNFDAETGFLYHILVSAEILDLATLLGEDIFYYEISILDTDNVLMIWPYRFYVEYRPAYEFYDLAYHNSLGGIDAVRLIGETNIEYQKSAEENDTGLDINEWNAAVKPYEKAYSSINLLRKYKGNIGLMKTRTKEQQEAYLELLVSKSIYMKVSTWWIPLLNIQQNASAGTRSAHKNGFDYEFQLSDSNEVFTPAAKTFGLGTL